jgi:hypothetical protein
LRHPPGRQPWLCPAAAPTVRAMTLAEDLLLLALDPRTGEFHLPAERLGLAMRTSFFVDLRMLRRVRLIEDGIEICDPTPTGQDHLDFALTHLEACGTPTPLRSWIDHGPGDTAIFRTLAVWRARALCASTRRVPEPTGIGAPSSPTPIRAPKHGRGSRRPSERNRRNPQIARLPSSSTSAVSGRASCAACELH